MECVGETIVSEDEHAEVVEKPLAGDGKNVRKMVIWGEVRVLDGSMADIL